MGFMEHFYQDVDDGQLPVLRYDGQSGRSLCVACLIAASVASVLDRRRWVKGATACRHPRE